MYLRASRKLLALKKIHAKTVSAKVIRIEKKSLIEGSVLPFATISKLFLLVFNKMDGMMYNAFRNPQIMNVQLAPCQNPLTKNIMKVFLTFIHWPPLLPPKGI